MHFGRCFFGFSQFSVYKLRIAPVGIYRGGAVAGKTHCSGVPAHITFDTNLRLQCRATVKQEGIYRVLNFVLTAGDSFLCYRLCSTGTGEYGCQAQL